MTSQLSIDAFMRAATDVLLARSLDANARQQLTPVAAEHGINEEELLNQLKDIIQQSMNAAHPGYIGHMDSIPSTASMLGDLVVGALNNNMLSVEMSPVLSRLEPLLVKEIAALFGLPKTASGILVSGGSLGNLQAIAVARNSHFPILEKELKESIKVKIDDVLEKLV